MGREDRQRGEENGRNCRRPQGLGEQPRGDRSAGIGAGDNVARLMLGLDPERQHGEEDGEPDGQENRAR